MFICTEPFLVAMLYIYGLVGVHPIDSGCLVITQFHVAATQTLAQRLCQRKLDDEMVKVPLRTQVKERHV